MSVPALGYLLEGRVKMHTRDGEEIHEAGQAFYWAPGAARAIACTLVLVCAALVSAAAANAASAPGSLDLSFDGDGKVLTQIGSSTDQATAVAIQPDGRIVVAGFSQSGTGHRFAVLRYNPDGSLDSTFDGDGKTTTAIGAGHRDEAYAVGLQADGRIVVAGDSYDAAGNSRFAVVRYTADGSLDSSFDGDGKMTTAVGAKSQATAIAVQGDGRILVGGTGQPCAGCGLFPALARYNPDGSLDAGFHDDNVSTPSGTRVLTQGYGNGGVARALAIQGNGKIVVAGDILHFSNRVLFVFRLEAGGGADVSFAGGDAAITDIAWEPNRATDLATAVDTLADGRIVVAGSTQVGSSFVIAALRYRDDGSLDSTFDGDGIVTTAVGTFSQGFGIAVDGDGRTVVAGDSFTGTTKDLALARYGSDGSLDPVFGTGGIVTTSVGAAADQARGMALQADGRVVVVGFSDNGIDQDDVVVARYHGSPPPDTTPPAVQCGSADGAWHPGDVSVACAASDGESGLADASHASFTLSTNVLVGAEDANASTNSRQVCDNAGNCTTAGPIPGNKVDKKAPAVSIVRPDAEAYLLNEAVSASYSCVDGGAGIASCSGPVADGASLDTASVGTKGFAVSATDGVGNAASETVSYVVSYDVLLLYDPAKPTRRIKLRLQDAAAASVSSPAIVLTAQSIDGSLSAEGTFSYSKGADGYVYVVDTRELGSGSHSLEFTAGADPNVHSVRFTVR